jgi:hypothetical protein
LLNCHLFFTHVHTQQKFVFFFETIKLALFLRANERTIREDVGQLQAGLYGSARGEENVKQ